MPHVVVQGAWRWYVDSTPDSGMVALAAQGVAPVLPSWAMQNAVLRLRVQLKETGAVSGSGTIQVQYNGGSGIFQTLAAQSPASGLEGWWFRYGNGAAAGAGTLTSNLLTGTTTSGKYVEADLTTATAFVSATQEIDVAIFVHWPPPDTTITFRIMYAGVALALDAGATAITLTTSTARNRPYTVTKLDGDLLQKTTREVRFASWPRIVYDAPSATWWCWTVQYDTPTILRSYWSTLAGGWTAGATFTFGASGNQSRHALAFTTVSGVTTLYVMFGDSSSSRRLVRGQVSGGVLTYGTEVTLTQASDRWRHIGVDAGNFVWIAGTTAAVGLWVRRSTSADSVTAWTTALAVSDITVVSGDVVTVVGLASNRVMVLWRPTGTNVPIKYAICTSTTVVTTGDVTTTTTTSSEDWGVARSGGFVYLLHSDSATSGGTWVMRVFTESTETWATGTAPGITGQVSNNDGIAMSADGNTIYAFATFLATGGSGQDRRVIYKSYTGPGTGGTWSAAADAATGGRVNSDHITAPRVSGNGRIVLLSAANDDDVVGNERTLEAWPIATSAVSMATPVRAIFYYPWFTTGSDPVYPGAWNQGAIKPWTQLHPTRGYYNSATLSVIDAHVADMVYAKFGAAIASWWGVGRREDSVMASLLNRSLGTSLKWCIYYEPEGNTLADSPGSPDPQRQVLAADLNYISSNYAHHPNYLWVGGKPVVFVWSNLDGLQAADQLPNQRWADANLDAVRPFYVNMKVWSGYAALTPQPDSWHQYAPAEELDTQGAHAVTISPGFWLTTETTPRYPRLGDSQWRADIRTMLAYSAAWKLVTSYNEFGEGSVIESVDGGSGRQYTGTGWESASGRGTFLDALEQDGVVATTRLAPDAIVASSGLTGTVAAIQDDPDSPDGTWLTG